MRKYFIHNGHDTQGPFSLDELKHKNISKKTPVWYEGLSEWIIAEEVEEMNNFVRFRKSYTANLGEQNIYILIALLVILLTSLYKLNSQSVGDGLQRREIMKHQTQITSNLKQEKYPPTHDLEIKIASQTDFLIQGFIKNASHSITYKEIEVEIVYYDKFQTILAKENHTIDDIFSSNTSKAFSFPVKKYRSLDFIDVKVYKASINQ